MTCEIAAFQRAVAPRLLPSGKTMSMQDALLIDASDLQCLWQERSAHLATQAIASDDGIWLNVADGVSASPAAALASHSYLKTLQAEIRASTASARSGNPHAIIRAAYGHWQRKHLRPATFGASTTLASLVASQNTYCAMNCGDSRIWLIRPSGDGGVHWHQLSRDHTTWQDLLDRGEVTAEQRDDYASIYNGLMHCLTLGDTDENDGLDDDDAAAHDSWQKPVLHTHKGQLESGDVIVLASDGLHDTLGDAIMRKVWQPAASLDANLAAWEQAFIKAGAPDDISVIALKV